jgi:large subunit ribosomal protein L25
MRSPGKETHIMEQTVVKATVGRELGSRPSRRLRAEGRLPGVVYGLGKEPQTVTVEYTELRTALTGPTGMNTVLTLDVDGTTETVLVRDVQRDPIKRLVTHADFLRVDPNRKVRVKVPIRLANEAKAVTDNGGMIEQNMFEIEVEVAPTSIPEFIEADISVMTLDRRLAVSDLMFPDDVESLAAEELSVVTPIIPRSAKVADDGVEGDEEAGDEAEGGGDAGDGDGDDAGGDE